MSKSSRELVENKLKNPVYCEILIKLNTREVYLFSFTKEFDKKRISLLNQAQRLMREKYLNRRFEGKKTLFSINWPRINEEFIKFLINKALEYEDYLQDWSKSYFAKTLIGQGSIKKFNNREFEYQQLILSAKKRKDLINNTYLQDFFKASFIKLNEQKDYKISFYDLFEYIIAKTFIELIPCGCESCKEQKLFEYVYNPLDPFDFLKHTLEYQKKNPELNRKIELAAKIKDKKIRTEILNEIKNVILTKPEIAELEDFVVFLPRVFEQLNKKWHFENVCG